MQTLTPTLTAPAISPAEVAFYRENGYLIVENALSPAEVEELRGETTALCRGERGDIRGVEPADPDESDDDILRRYLCIHFPHKLSDVMYRYLDHPAIVETLTGVIGPNVKCMQSMLFIKPAGKPGQAWHQDEDFIPTRDLPCLFLLHHHFPGPSFPKVTTLSSLSPPLWTLSLQRIVYLLG